MSKWSSYLQFNSSRPTVTCFLICLLNKNDKTFKDLERNLFEIRQLRAFHGFKFTAAHWKGSFFFRFNFKIHHCKRNCMIPVIKNSLELTLLYGCWIKLEYAIILYLFVIHILSCVNSRHYMRLQEYMDIAVWIIISKRSCKVEKSHEGKQEYFFKFYFHDYFDSVHKQCQVELRKLPAWVWLSVTKTSLSVSDGPYMH